MNFEYFKREGEFTPDFIGRATYVSDEFPPLRAYFSQCGLEEAFPADDSAVEAMNHLIDTLKYNRTLIQNADFLVAALWGDEGDKMIDLFRYSDGKGWPGNPGMSAFVLRNAAYVIDDRYVTREDMLVILGEEGKYRKTTKSLNEYMEKPPAIEGLVAITPQPQPQDPLSSD